MHRRLDHKFLYGIPKSQDLALDFFGFPSRDTCSNDGSRNIAGTSKRSL